MKIASWFLPTPRNNYRARLLSNTALCMYVILLVVSNIAFGNLSMVRSSAALSEMDLVKLHNEQRGKQGLPGLSFNSLLAQSAKEKGIAMIKSDCWSHYCPDGKSPWDFFRDANYVYSFAGENLAEGFNNNEAVMRAWMNSKTHRENILKGEFTEIGIALVSGLYQGRQDNTVIVVHFGKPKSSLQSAQTAPERQNSPEQIPTGSQLEITSPKENEFISTQSPVISGSASESIKQLDYNLKTSGQSEPATGRVPVEGGLFTIATEELADGQAQIEITPLDLSDMQIGPASSRKFTIDTTPPSFDVKNLLLAKNVIEPDGNSISSFSLSPIEQLTSAELLITYEQLPPQIYPFEKDPNTGEWNLELARPASIKQASLIQTDLAGNSSNTNISLAELAAQSTVQTAGVAIDSGVNWLQIFGIIVVSFLLGLFIIDHVQMRRLKAKLHLPQVERSHLHIPTLSILLLMILMGNFTGVI